MSNILYISLGLAFFAFGSSLDDGRRVHKRDCVFTWPATDEDTCATMSRDWLLDEAEFKAMNPGVDCSDLIPGQEYCVEWDGVISVTPVITPTVTPTSSMPSAVLPVTTTSSSTAPGGPTVPSPVQSGVASDCQSWHLVQEGDTCQGIVASYERFTLAQFYQWNPAVGTTCRYLQIDVFVCVGIPGTPTAKPAGSSSAIQTTMKTTTKTSQPVPTTTPKPCRWNSSKGQYDCPGMWPAAPGPTQEGIPYDCIKWVLQKSGQYCTDMAKAAGIPLARFYALNPAVGTNCGGLWPGYAYCVAIE